MVTIQDVAKKANVSAMTVTRVINSPSSVSEKTKKIVQEAIDELGYIPNFNACALRASSSNFIGITIYDIKSPYMANLIKDLESKLKLMSKQLIVFFVDEDDIDDYKVYCKARSVNVDLNIFIPSLKTPIFEKLPLEEKRRNLQLFRKQYDDIDSFVVDDIYGAYIATNHLIKKGNQRIMLVDYDQRVSMKRDIGFKNSLKENGIKFDPNQLVLLPEFDSNEYEKKVTDAILTYKPTAVIAVTEKLSLLCLDVFKKLNLEIKKDIDFVSYDDSDLISRLGITCVYSKFEEMSETIANLIDFRLKNKNEKPKSFSIKPSLIIRD